MLDYGCWLLSNDRGWREARVAEGKRHGKTVIARLEGVDDRDQAFALIGTEVGVLRDELPDTEAGQYYWTDLEGLDVVRRDGSRVGRVAQLLETGANDVMVVKGEREMLIPFVMEKVIVDVDLAKGVITVDWDWD